MQASWDGRQRHSTVSRSTLRKGYDVSELIVYIGGYAHLHRVDVCVLFFPREALVRPECVRKLFFFLIDKLIFKFQIDIQCRILKHME